MSAEDIWWVALSVEIIVAIGVVVWAVRNFPGEIE